MKIKIISVLFLMPILALADYQFVVENTTMVDTYFNIFNAIASLFQSDSYIDLLRLVFLIGGFFVFAGGVLSSFENGGGANKTLVPYLKYSLIGVALLTFMFSGKENLWITTNNIPSYCEDVSPTTGTVVAMPGVLAYFFSTTNTVGTSLTRLAENAFGGVSGTYGSAKMSDSNGYLGALKETIRILSFNPNLLPNQDGTFDESFLTMYKRFFNYCVYEVAQNKGSKGEEVIQDLISSKNTTKWIDNYIATNPFADTEIGYPPALNLIPVAGEYTTCEDYFKNIKDKVYQIDGNGKGYSCIFPFANAGVLELLTGTATGKTKSELEGIAMQSALIQAMSGTKLSNISGADYAAGKTRAQSNQENLATAHYMAEMLPYLQMTMRAILYAFFPFVFITILLPGGLKVLGQYAQTVLWIELWGPTAAIVNMFVNMQAKTEVGSKFSEQGLTLMSSIDMLGELNTIAGVGAMLYLSIPALTWLIISGSGQMLGNLASGVAGKFSKNLESGSIAQDMANLEKHSDVNKARAKAGMAAQTYGEMMHYEASMKGMQEAGTMIATMKNGGLNAARNMAEVKTGAELKGNEGLINQLGSTDNVIDAKAQTSNYNEMKDIKSASDILKHFGGDVKKAADFIGSGDAFDKIVGAGVANNIRKELGIQNSTDAKTKEQLTNQLTQLKTEMTAEERSTAQAAQLTEQGRQKLEEDKTKVEQILSNTKASAQKQIDDLINAGFSEADATSIVARALSEKGINNEELNKKAHKLQYEQAEAQYKAREKFAKEDGFKDDIKKEEKSITSKLAAIKGLEEAKSKTSGKTAESIQNRIDILKAEISNSQEKIATMKAVTSKEYRDAKLQEDKDNIDKFFIDSGAATKDNNGNMIWDDTLRNLNSMNKGDNAYHQRISSISGTLNGMGIQQVTIDGGQTQIVTDILGNKATDVKSFARGISKQSVAQNDMGFHLQKNMSEDARENYGVMVSGADALLKVSAVAFTGANIGKNVVNVGTAGVSKSKDIVNNYMKAETIRRGLAGQPIN